MHPLAHTVDDSQTPEHRSDADMKRQYMMGCERTYYQLGPKRNNQ